MRLLFENGGRTGMRDAEAVGGGLGLWSPAFGALYVEPNHFLLRSAADLADLVKSEDLDAVGAALWAEAEALTEAAKLAEVAPPGQAGTTPRL